ncbi:MULTISPECIES: hypothetical protein [unclassified Mesorhizobium]|uniref:hypothetical protein n=1 Tax=unclassified Mesorhizobium TaxID=325217 RepID=UPI000FD27990|nr:MULTISPECIES: hypothetical protein [unclassified Mesorhizobium]RUV93989.1 hypothetical protein EOA88_06340 [Mesorhizobium sp. M5C.F.Ca.IN.020.14.1.1]RUV29999.1 hypothetical protein EOA86_13075 [Mesorhizobium sp. M5C.F.Ca.IN.020.32.2.1]RWG48531.1 MAG: hypothetical protein EOQ62_09210 [Mesorhizobium sp.]RWH49967.1 MAG: hypothetical protein EOQ80_05150 [Mesorhizobium sp.]RWH57563.1 MAG: hypothetical protein EOQ82_08360 [Mesorhizobium sp.]
MMILLPPIGRLLAFFAVLGLLLGPFASLMAGTAMAVPVVMEMAEGMPCPDGPPSLPDCDKDCPLVALCMPVFTSTVASVDDSLAIPPIVGSKMPPHGYSPGASLHHEPHPRPPKA